MMKRSMLIACFATATALFFLLGVCLAEEIKIGFVDIMKFAEKSQKAKEQQQRFAQKVESMRNSLENKKKELQNLQDQLQKQGPMLKEETRNLKIKEIGIKEMEFKLAEKDAQSELQNEQRDAQEVFRKDLSKIIGQLRAQKKLTLIVNAEALLAADDTLDITDEVVRMYDGDAGIKPGGPKPAATKPPAPASAPATAPAGPAKPKPK
ncbi:MAG TPA: OmpH family outer membrane protein [Desulfomonilaceae bacterium]|nr:OmpH family outer membrane protein [Desulfomonilaceae bacterium]